MGAVRFNVRVAFMRQTAGSRNSLTAPEPSWDVLGHDYADRSDVKDAEKIEAGRDASQILSRFLVRASVLTRQVIARDRLILNGTFTEGGALIAGDPWSIVGVKTVPGRKDDRIEITAVFDPSDAGTG